MANQQQQQPPAAAASRSTIDLYQQLTTIPFTDSAATDSLAADPPKADAGFVDLVIWAVLIASLAIGFWA